MLGIIGLIFLTYYASRWLNKRMYNSKGKSIKIVEREMLSQDKYLAVVKVGSKLMMIGVTGHHIDKICDLEESDLCSYLTEKQEVTHSNSFFENLKIATKQHPYIKPFIKDEENKDDK